VTRAATPQTSFVGAVRLAGPSVMKKARLRGLFAEALFAFTLLEG
jgi:hypothetical protein